MNITPETKIHTNVKTIGFSIIFAIVAGLQFTGCSTTPDTQPTESVIEGHMVWKQRRIQYDPPGIIFRALFDDLSKLQKDLYETRAQYEERIRIINEYDESFIFLIHPDYCEYRSYPEQGKYTIASRDFYAGAGGREFGFAGYAPYGITIHETNREVEYIEKDVLGADTTITEVHHEVWKLSFLDFRRFPNELIQFRDEESGFPHFGISLQFNSKAFATRLTNKKIGLALRVRLADCRDAEVQYEGPGLGRRSSSISHTYIYNLPVEILDVWLVDIGTDYSIVQWLRDYL